MVVYTVMWSADRELTKGKGRVKNDNSLFCISVLCRNSHDALTAFNYLFYQKHGENLSAADGQITLRRSVLDSRGFNAMYILMDGMREPLSLGDFKDSLTRYAMRFHGTF